MKFEETAMPQAYSGKMEKDHSMSVNPTLAKNTLEILLSAMTDFLSLVSREEDTALIIDDEAGNLLMAGVLSYHENEDDEDMPGNYSFAITVNDEDLKEIKEANKYGFGDSKFMQQAGTTAYELYAMRFMQPQYAVTMFRTIVQTLLEWLDTNAKEGEETSVELDGYFVATVGVEDGEKVIAITPDGALKRKIKDDSALEEKQEA